jgi:serine/threonine protein kinase
VSAPSKKFIGKWIGQRYCIELELGRGGMGEVYQAFNVEDPSNDVAIKVIHRTQKMTSADLLRFQKEASLMSQLYHSNIIAFHELGIFQGEEAKDFSGGYYIIMDFARGKSLNQSIKNEGRKDLAFLFQVGLQVADALDYTHGKNIIHSDVKPHNIIVSQVVGGERGVHVQVLDFGVARLGSMIGRDEDANQEKAGTPLYMAPELSATGFGTSDHRVDLYSLGCVLYEILTGSPPFHGSNREELERAHQSSSPESIRNVRPDVPLVVAQIIHKLLAKRPDDRYQTAFSLSADLLKAKAAWELNPSVVPSFSLAQKDEFFAVSARLPISGRDAEISTILNEYKQVSSPKGRARITVVTGGPGIGKTRVLDEFKSKLSAMRIQYVTGLFTQHENSLPFNALANAFNELLVKIIRINPVEAELLSKKIKQIIGPDAHLVANVVPGLKPFLGDIQEPADGLESDGENYPRFAKAFADFARSLAPDTQPMVMILDDVHWADPKSLALITQIFSNANSHQYHLVIACRKDVEGVDSDFAAFIEKFKGLKLRYSEVNLKALDFEASSGLVSSMLRQNKPVGSDLVQYLLARSGGVPMHLVELTRRMVALDMITLNRTSMLWEWDINEIQGAVISLNAVDLVLGSLGEFKGVDLAILRAAACNGMSFQYELLLLAGQNSATNVIRLIDRALSCGVIVRHHETENLRHLGKAYIFIHKKVRDAIYNVIDPSERAAIHEKIAKQLLTSIENPQDQLLFSLVQHLNKSRHGDVRVHEFEALCLRFNVAAGTAMRKKQGWTAAYNYYSIANELISKGGPSEFGASARRQVIENLADINTARSNFKVALTQYALCLELPMSNLEYAAVSAKAAELNNVCGNISDAKKLVSKGLQALGEPKPSVQLLSSLRYYWGLVADVVTMGWSRGRWSVGLALCNVNNRKHGRVGGPISSAATLYRQLTVLSSRQNGRLASSALDFGVKLVLTGEASVHTTIRIAADRAGQLAGLGLTAASYRLFDLADRLASEFSSFRNSGYVSLIRATTIDYIKGRPEDTALHLNEAFNGINQEHDGLAYVNLLLFKQYFDLMSGKMGNAETLNASVRTAIPTRNHLSSVSMAILMFGLLLQNRRQRLVGIGEEFIRRRRSVGAREDLFTVIVMTMQLFARGEMAQTQTQFQKITKFMMSQEENEVFEVWQMDLIGIFVLVFPMLFKGENKQSGSEFQLTGAWIVDLNDSIRRRAWQSAGRSAQLMIEARCADLMGKTNFSKLYDKALLSAKGENNIVCLILIYFWFGRHLLSLQKGRRTDYLKLSHKMATEYGLEGLASHILRAGQTSRDAKRQKSQRLRDDRQVAASYERADLNVGFNHLDHIVRVAGAPSDFREDLMVSLRFIEQLMPDCKTAVYLASHIKSDPVVLSSLSAETTARILRDVAPYFTIRQTLSVHVSEVKPTADFAGSDVKTALVDLGETLRPQDLPPLGVNQSAPESSSGANNNSTTPSGGATIAAATSIAPTSIAPTSIGATSIGTSPTDNGVSRGSESRKQNSDDVTLLVLVPIRVGGETIGIIVVTNLGQEVQNELSTKKRDLDALAPQFGLLMSQKFPPVIRYLEETGRAIPIGMNTNGGSFFEAAPNLEIKLHGKLRVERESSWYLGVDWGGGQYVVVYCCLKGEALEREMLAQQLFYHIYAMRELASIRGQVKNEVLDLRIAIQELLKNSAHTARMDEIMLSYSLFDHESRFVSSGHYGTARPLVIGTENRLAAFNQTSLRLKDGRDLRYWEIFAVMNSAQIFLVSYDTSRISVDVPLNSATIETGATGSQRAESPEALLDSVLQNKTLPRYFLTVKRLGM